MAATEQTIKQVNTLGDTDYKYGFSTELDEIRPPKGLNEDIIKFISAQKDEPEWMLDWRLNAFKVFNKLPKPEWAKLNIPEIDYQDCYYYSIPKSLKDKPKSLDEIDPEIIKTYEKLGIPEAERTYLAGVTAQYESEVVYHKNREDLEKLGVLFCDMDTAVREYPELVQEYFGTVIPPGCLLYTSPSPRDAIPSRMPSSA